jgi:hypothetical protein
MRFYVILIATVCLAQVNSPAQIKRVLSAPESLAGRWETSDGHRGVVGMNVIITTHIQGAPNRIDGHPQYEDEFTVGVERRSVPNAESSGFIFFSSMAGEGAAWDGHRLTIHLLKADLRKVNIDLTWHEGPQTWDGLFELDAFREQVSLKRPSSKTLVSPFAGTWFDPSEMMNNCLHISQQQDGALAVWSDDIQRPGEVRYSPGSQPPTQTLEHYGEIAKAEVHAPNQVKVELRAHTPICCSHPFSATVSADGKSMTGNWFAGPNQAPREVKWRKMPGISCMNVSGPDTR